MHKLHFKNMVQQQNMVQKVVGEERFVKIGYAGTRVKNFCQVFLFISFQDKVCFRFRGSRLRSPETLLQTPNM